MKLTKQVSLFLDLYLFFYDFCKLKHTQVQQLLLLASTIHLLPTQNHARSTAARLTTPTSGKQGLNSTSRAPPRVRGSSPKAQTKERRNREAPQRAETMTGGGARREACTRGEKDGWAPKSEEGGGGKVQPWGIKAGLTGEGESKSTNSEEEDETEQKREERA